MKNPLKHKIAIAHAHTKRYALTGDWDYSDYYRMLVERPLFEPYLDLELLREVIYEIAKAYRTRLKWGYESRRAKMKGNRNAVRKVL